MELDRSWVVSCRDSFLWRREYRKPSANGRWWHLLLLGKSRSTLWQNGHRARCWRTLQTFHSYSTDVAFFRKQKLWWTARNKTTYLLKMFFKKLRLFKLIKRIPRSFTTIITNFLQVRLLVLCVRKTSLETSIIYVYLLFLKPFLILFLNHCFHLFKKLLTCLTHM